MAITISKAFLVVASFLAVELLAQVQASKCDDLEACVAKANQTTQACNDFMKFVGMKSPVCNKTDKDLKGFCRSSCTPDCSDDCVDCYDKIDTISEECANFYRTLGQTDVFVQQKCGYIRRSIQGYCFNKCPICQDSFCKNGGKCFSSRSSAYKCQCPPAYIGVYCQTGACELHPCQNGGTCTGLSKCQCTPEFTGPQCQEARFGLRNNPAENGEAIVAAGHSRGSGLYWIQPPGENEPAQTYVDMDNYGGGWMLASYGYMYTTGCNSNNRNMINMNIPYGFNWLPEQRQSTHGVINLPRGAVYLARSAKQMIMAAGGNPDSGGISGYSYVYRVNISGSPYNITFANHERYRGAIGQNGIPQMHITNFTVEALKGESGTKTRYALGEALGVTSADSYRLTGYGFDYRKDTYCISCTVSGGPFFPSIHTSGGGCGPYRYFKPDVQYSADTTYSSCGWKGISGSCYSGQMSIWFK